MNGKILFALIGLIASIITIFSFISGKDSLYELADSDIESGEINLREVNHSEALLKNGIYVEPSPFRDYSDIFKTLLLPVLILTDASEDKIFLVEGKRKKMFLTTSVWDGEIKPGYKFPFIIKMSPSKEKFIVALRDKLHISNKNGNYHNVIPLKNGILGNVIFHNEKTIRFNVSRKYNDIIKIGRLQVEFPGVYEISIDDNNFLTKIIGLYD